MVRFIHTADWQLGMTRHFLKGEAQARFTQARIEAVAEIGDLAVREGCAFVVVAGDVFESNHVERQVVLRALDAMGAAPEVTFLLLPGNHDPLDASSVFRSVAFERHRPSNVVVLDGTAPVAVSPEAPSQGNPGALADAHTARPVEVIGAPWSNKAPMSDLVSAAIEAIEPVGDDRAPLRVVVGHGAIDYLCPEDDHPATLSLSSIDKALDDGVVHYVALGDRHSLTQVGGSGRIWYSGAPEPTDFDEVDPGQVLIVELTDDGVEVTPQRLGRWSFERKTFEVSASEDVEGVREYFEAVPDKLRTIVKVSLVGQVSLGDYVALEEVLEVSQERLAALQRWEPDSDLVVVPDDDDFEVMGLTGFASKALEDLRSLADQPATTGAVATGAATGDTDRSEHAVAQEAMRLLYRLNSTERQSVDRAGSLGARS